MTTNNRQQTQTTTRTLDEKAIIRKLSLCSIVGNTVLSGFKLFAGVAGHSGAMISDSIHSFSDVLTTFIAWFGVKISKKAPDLDHPYGHERLECVASLVLGAVLLVTGLSVGKSGLATIVSGQYETLAVPGVIALVAAVVSIAGKEAMYWYTRYYAKLIHSSAFMADAWHHRSDAFSSIGSLIGIAGARLGFPVLDAVASVVICLFIIKVAYDIMKDAIVKMLDTSCGEEYENKIIDFVSAQEGVVGVDKLRTRMFGNKVYVDIEISMDGNETLRQSHQTAEEIHDRLESQFTDVKHIMIHVNPAEKSA